MKNRTSNSSSDPKIHVRKKVAGGATGAMLGAAVAGPIGALLGGALGTMIGVAAEEGQPATKAKSVGRRTKVAKADKTKSRTGTKVIKTSKRSKSTGSSSRKASASRAKRGITTKGSKKVGK